MCEAFRLMSKRGRRRVEGEAGMERYPEFSTVDVPPSSSGWSSSWWRRLDSDGPGSSRGRIRWCRLPGILRLEKCGSNEARGGRQGIVRPGDRVATGLLGSQSMEAEGCRWYRKRSSRRRGSMEERWRLSCSSRRAESREKKATKHRAHAIENAKQGKQEKSKGNSDVRCSTTSQRPSRLNSGTGPVEDAGIS